MNMVRHETESQYPVTVPFNTLLQKKVEPVSVLVVKEYVLSAVATKDYMIKCTGIMYAWFTCHV